MLSDRQVFRNDRATTGALLRRAPGVNQRHTTTSFFRFVHSELHELTPGHICYALVDGPPAVLLHVLNVKVLEGDELVLVHQPARLLMSKVAATVRGAAISVLQGAHNLAALWTSPGKPLFLALQTSNVSRVSLRPSLAPDFLSVGEDGEGSQAQVDAHNPVGRRQRTGLDNARETSIPATYRIAPDGQRLAFACKRPVQPDSHIAYLGQAQPVIRQEAPVALRLRVRERIVPIPPPESRIARLFPGPDAAKESAKGKVNALLSILHGLGVTPFQPPVLSLPSRQELVGVLPTERLLLLFPRIAAHFQRLVVRPAAGVKLRLQGGALRRRGEKPVLERLSHEKNYTMIPTYQPVLCSDCAIHLPAEPGSPLALFL